VGISQKDMITKLFLFLYLDFSSDPKGQGKERKKTCPDRNLKAGIFMPSHSHGGEILRMAKSSRSEC
jgi:hypothetical protein